VCRYFEVNLKKILFLYTLLIFYFSIICFSYSQSFSGIEIGSNINLAKNIGSLPIANSQSGPVDIAKWRLDDGNYLSITSYRNSGKIVFMEIDWNGSPSSVLTDFDGLFFGKTTHNDLINKFSSLGFIYQNRGVTANIEGTTVSFNSYEIKNKSVVVTFMTSLKITNGLNKDNIRNNMYLSSIIIASNDYMNIIWGDKKIYSTNYIPLPLNLLQTESIGTLNSKNINPACQRFPNLCQ